MVVISVDCGRSGVKAVSESERIYFPSFLGKSRMLRNERQMGVDDFDVQYSGKQYFIGRVAGDEAHDGKVLMLPYKVHNDTKILVLTAVHRLVNDGAHVFLVTGQPLAFHNKHDQQQMKSLLLGHHAVTVNGVTKEFTLERVEVGAEGATVAWSLGRRNHDRFHVLDVGSRTVNYATALKGRWVDRESDSLDYGWATFKGSEEEFARYVIADLSQLLIPLGPIVLIGGKTSLVEPLKQYFPHVEAHPDALFANAMAFRELGVIAYERQEAQASER